VTTANRRPMFVPEPGKRVVLVTPRPCRGVTLEATLDGLAELGWVVTAIVDPAEHIEALRIVAEGSADVVVVTRPEYMPTVVLAGDLLRDRPRDRRTRPVLRPPVAQLSEAGQLEQPERITGSAVEGRTQHVPRSESGTGMPNFGRHRRPHAVG
jgi:hypothetical protein